MIKNKKTVIVKKQKRLSKIYYKKCLKEGNQNQNELYDQNVIVQHTNNISVWSRDHKL